MGAGITAVKLTALGRPQLLVRSSFYHQSLCFFLKIIRIVYLLL